MENFEILTFESKLSDKVGFKGFVNVRVGELLLNSLGVWVVDGKVVIRSQLKFLKNGRKIPFVEFLSPNLKKEIEDGVAKVVAESEKINPDDFGDFKVI